MSIKLLDDVVEEILLAVYDPRFGVRPRDNVRAILERTVRERAGLMHERAQRAESRAAQAEKLLDRLTTRAGRLE